MSEISNLCLKYRPKKLEDVWGNEEAKEFIKSLLQSSTLPSSIILYGQNGIGKSTMAYIISRILNCENPTDYVPCGVCRKCQLMDKMYITGDTVNGLDIFKYDIGLKTSSEYINQIVTSIKKPTRPGSKKIIHIDELQLLSFNEQEKLNNPIEFCNPNTHILITTTNLNAIAKSIKSRSTVINLITPSPDEQANKLVRILFNEKQPSLLSKNELKILAEISGAPRRTLQNLQDILSAGKEHYYKIVNKINEDNDLYVKYFESLSQGIISLIEFIETLPEPIKFISGLDKFIYRCICSRYGKRYINNKSIKDILIHSDKNLVNTIKTLAKSKFYEEDEVREMLLVIGFDLNQSIADSLNKSDANNVIFTTTDIKENTNEAEKTLQSILSSNFGDNTKFNMEEL